jgi:hypothetical protein
MAAILVTALGVLAFAEAATCGLPARSLDYVACSQVAEWLSRTWHGSQGSPQRAQESGDTAGAIRLTATAEGALSGDYTSYWEGRIFTLAGGFTCGGTRPPTVALAVSCKNDLGSMNSSIAWTGWLQTDCLEGSSSWVLHTTWLMMHIITEDDISVKTGREEYRPRPARPSR